MPRIRPASRRAYLRVLASLLLVSLAPVVSAEDLAGQDDIAGAVAAALDDARIVAIGENHGHVEFHRLSGRARPPTGDRPRLVHAGPGRPGGARRREGAGYRP